MPPRELPFAVAKQLVFRTTHEIARAKMKYSGTLHGLSPNPRITLVAFWET